MWQPPVEGLQLGGSAQFLRFTYAASLTPEQQAAYEPAGQLTEEGLYNRAQIYATDMSSAAVEQAREGVYPESLLPEFAMNYRSAGGEHDFGEYWSRAYGRVSVRPALKQNVHFFQHDLVSDYSLGEMHVIFCRNVLIYFGEQLRQRVFSLFADGLERGGFLCLGASEALPGTERAGYQDVAPNQRIFRRRSQ